MASAVASGATRIHTVMPTLARSAHPLPLRAAGLVFAGERVLVVETPKAAGTRLAYPSCLLGKHEIPEDGLRRLLWSELGASCELGPLVMARHTRGSVSQSLELYFRCAMDVVPAPLLKHVRARAAFVETRALVALSVEPVEVSALLRDRGRRFFDTFHYSAHFASG